MVNKQKRRFRRRGRNGVRKISYILLMVIIICAYMVGQSFWMSILGAPEPLVQCLRATLPEKESHFHYGRATL